MSYIDFEIQYNYRSQNNRFSIQYIPVLEADLPLRSTLGSTIHPDPSNCPGIKPLTTEIESHIPPKRAVSLGTSTTYTSNQLTIFSKYVSETFGGFPLSVNWENSIQCTYIESVLGKSNTREFYLPITQLSPVNQKNVEAIDRWMISKVREHFYSNLPDSIKKDLPDLAKKTKIFLSLRGSYIPQGEHLHSKLKEYANASLFEPYIFSLDMAPGRWISQLEDSIDDSNIFMPLLTNDYYYGPISVQEHDQAVRKAETDTKMTIVPVLLEGSERDYAGKFIGNYTIKKIPMDEDDEDYDIQFEKLISFLLTPPY